MGKPNTLGPGPHADVGKRIREAFEHAGWKKLSYEKIGAKLDLSGGAVGKLLNGHIAGSADTIRKISVLTNTNFDYISTGRGDLAHQIGGGKFSTDGLTDEQKRIVESVIQTLRSTPTKV